MLHEYTKVVDCITNTLSQVSDIYCSESVDLFVRKNSSYFAQIFARFSNIENQFLAMRKQMTFVTGESLLDG